MARWPDCSSRQTGMCVRRPYQRNEQSTVGACPLASSLDDLWGLDVFRGQLCVVEWFSKLLSKKLRRGGC
jgi:hypothetical protein